MSPTRHLLRTTSALRRCIVGSTQPFATSTSSAQVVDAAKSAQPLATNNQMLGKPTASIPAPEKSRRKTFRSRLQSETIAEQPVAHDHEETDETQDEALALPSSCWAVINNVPPLATLEDITKSVDKVLDIEREIGILDVDTLGTGNKLDLDPDVPWVKSARALLSRYGRPTKWSIKLDNRSIVHAFLEHTKENGFMCVWKESTVEAWDPDSGDDHEIIEVSNSVIRVENCPPTMTADHVRHLFRRFDYARDSPSVTQWEVEESRYPHYMFLVRFADASWARAAIREMQGIEIGGNQLKLAQYPNQLL